MRKVKPVRKLGRTAAHRKATLSNLSTQLLVYKRIETTEAKAKETRRVVEKIITKARKGTVHARECRVGVALEGMECGDGRRGGLRRRHLHRSAGWWLDDRQRKVGQSSGRWERRRIPGLGWNAPDAGRSRLPRHPPRLRHPPAFDWTGLLIRTLEAI